MDVQAIVKLVSGVTGKWCRQRKAEERERSRTLRRRQALVPSERVTIKEAAYAVMEQAYRKASSDGSYPAHARQIMYAARGPIQEETDRQLDDQYFCQTLLPDYLNDHPQATAAWDVVFDARGHFEEPHTKLVVPLGTLDVRKYLRDVQMQKTAGCLEFTLPDAVELFPTSGPVHRFSAILFIEKEGFLPLFRAVRLAERFDIAIMSTKGLSVTASRLLVDRLCGEHDIPLLVLRDLDKSGFSIVGTLRRNTRRYSFENRIRVIDLGLRLADVEEWDLEAEEAVYGKSDPARNLRKNGATEEEIAFLRDELPSAHGYYYGRRVELNAFTSENLIAWIEAGLKRHGVTKTLPDADTLAEAFRQGTARALMARRMEEIAANVLEQARTIDAPDAFAGLVEARLEEDPALSWDAVIGEMASDATASHQPPGQ